MGAQVISAGTAGPLFHQPVGINEGPSASLSQQPADCGFTAARQPDEHNIGGLRRDQRGDPVDFAVVNMFAAKQLTGLFGLGRQHIQPVQTGDAPGLRLQEQRRPGRIVDQVQHTLKPRKGRQTDRCNAIVRKHAYRRGVYDHPGVGMARNILIIVRPAAGDHDNLRRSQIPEDGADRSGGAAAAQHQAFAPGNGNA